MFYFFFILFATLKFKLNYNINQQIGNDLLASALNKKEEFI